jgi:hypothetical protein
MSGPLLTCIQPQIKTCVDHHVFPCISLNSEHVEKHVEQMLEILLTSVLCNVQLSV